MNLSLRNVFISAIVLGTFAPNSLAQHGESEGPDSPQIISHKTNGREGFAPTAGSTGQQAPPITYHGGPVMGTPNVYVIWYGNWNQANGSDTPLGQTIVRDFLHGLNNSPYFQINRSYGQPTGGVIVGAETTDNYSHGSRLSDGTVQAVVWAAISGNKLPMDSNGLYFVLTSSDVAETSGFCSRYCGWHTAGTLNRSTIRYSFVGNASRCLNGCAAQTVGPNGNAGVDGMVSVMAHELEETITDPNLNAWYDSNGAENGDKCAWTFGQVIHTAANGAYYNVTLPAVSVANRNYLIQRNLNATNSACYINYLTGAQ